MQIWWQTAATAGRGHLCLCVVLIKIEIYALPAFMGLSHCGVADAHQPPPLSRQNGWEADVINGSLSFWPMSASLSNPSRPNTNRVSGWLQTLPPDEAFSITRSPCDRSTQFGQTLFYSVFIRLGNGNNKLQLRRSHVVSRS